jgi:hypothetical protein
MVAGLATSDIKEGSQMKIVGIVATASICSLLPTLGGANLAWGGRPLPTPAPTAAQTYPSARYWHSMASNGKSAASTSRIYMFGGNAGKPGTAYLNDLWYYRASSGVWTSLSPAGRSWPELGRGNGALSCGAGKCVVFAGTTGTKDLNETWYFTEPADTSTNVAWTKVSCSKPAACPSARMVPLVAFDVSRGYHVSFGGIHDVAALGDTWTFSGTSWKLRQSTQPTSGPAVRSWGSAAYVPTHVSNGTPIAMDKVVIFGGDPYPNAPYPAALCDMYAFNGSTWDAIAASGAKPCLFGATMAWDTSVAASPRLMIAGGFKDAPGTVNTDTWYFTFSSSTTGSWTKASTGVCAPLDSARGAYEIAGKKLVFFGGMHSGGYAYGDTLVCP